MDAFVELEYPRAEDGRPVTLVSPLPTVRTLAIGGAPTDLRLPGTPADAVYAHIGCRDDAFHVWPAEATAGRLTINGDALPAAGVELHDGDVVSFDQYELRFHEGAPGPDEQYANTPCRWRVSLPDLGLRREGELEDDPADAHRREFDLSIRPLQQSRGHAEVYARAEAELLRLIRSDAAEELEPFARYLWRVRIESAMEFKPIEETLELAREAADLYPAATGLLTLLGIVHLRRRDWTAARESFQRALRFAERRKLGFLHEARLGVILADTARRDDFFKGEWNGASDLRDAAGWTVTPIDLHAPADDLPFWNLVRQARIFGDPEKTRFGLVSPPARAATGGEEQRWIIYDVEKRTGLRQIIRYPTLAYTDPSLMVEMTIYRQAAEASRPDWCAGFVEFRPAESTGPATDGPPVALERSAIDRLTRELHGAPAWVRISLSRPTGQSEVWVEVVSQPLPGDVMYDESGLRIAVAGSSAARLAGTALSFEEFSPGTAGFALVHPANGRCRVFFRNLVTARQARRAWSISGALTTLLAVIAVAAAANVVLRMLFLK